MIEAPTLAELRAAVRAAERDYMERLSPAAYADFLAARGRYQSACAVERRARENVR